jgi:hypothetical protein
MGTRDPEENNSVKSMLITLSVKLKMSLMGRHTENFQIPGTYVTIDGMKVLLV